MPRHLGFATENDDMTMDMQTSKQEEVGQAFSVLIIEDERLYAQAIARELKRKKVVCDLAYTAEDGLRLATENVYHAVLLDHKLPDDDGIRIIPTLQARQPRAGVVMMTAFETVQNAVQAIRQGAEDYIVKQPSVAPIVERMLEIRSRHRIREQQSGWDEHKKSGIIGQSSPIQQVVEQLDRVAGHVQTTVLLTGETGVGKEVAARYLHSLSTPQKPFIAVDCVALPSELVESLLFGHERGSFTGADRKHEGAFQEAEDGVIFLDEIGDMDLQLQGKLLRALENRTFQRVGSVKEYPMRARVIAATNRDLLEQVKQGTFRFDLYQRLSVFPIQIPPLRDRGSDILLLADHFVSFLSEKMGREAPLLAEDAKQSLSQYDFPGNVRELKNAIERALILADQGQLTINHLPERIRGFQPDQSSASKTAEQNFFDFIPGVDTLETLERKMIHKSLLSTGGVKSEAAKLLGISRFQLLRRMEKYNMKTPGKEPKQTGDS